MSQESKGFTLAVSVALSWIPASSSAPADHALQINSNLSHKQVQYSLCFPVKHHNPGLQHLHSTQHHPPSSHNSSKALTCNGFSNPEFQTPSQSSQDNLVRPVTETDYPPVPISGLFIFCCWGKNHEQEHLGDKRVLTVHHEGKAGQEPKAGQDQIAGTEAETTEECCSPVWTLLDYSVSFFTLQDYYPGMAQPRVGWATPHIKKMPPQACLQANRVGALSQLRFPLLSLCLAKTGASCYRLNCVTPYSQAHVTIIALAFRKGTNARWGQKTQTLIHRVYTVLGGGGHRRKDQGRT